MLLFNFIKMKHKQLFDQRIGGFNSNVRILLGLFFLDTIDMYKNSRFF
jgi:hypothetical protein